MSTTRKETTGGAPSAGRGEFDGADMQERAQKRALQKWARQFARAHSDEKRQRSMRAELEQLAQVSERVKAAIEKLSVHLASTAPAQHTIGDSLEWDLRFLPLLMTDRKLSVPPRQSDFAPAMATIRRWLNESATVLPALESLAQAATEAAAMQPERGRGRAREDEKLVATLTLIKIFERYSDTTARRINDSEGSYGKLHDFVVAAFTMAGVTKGATSQLQKALKLYRQDRRR